MSDANKIQFLAALRHPLRRDILRRMYGKDAISPKDLSAAMGAPLSNVLERRPGACVAVGA